MKIVSSFAITFGLTVLLSGSSFADDVPQENEVPIIKQWSGGYSGVRTPGQEVVKDAEAWKTLWNRVNSNRRPAPKPPEVDFEMQTVVAVFMGTRNSGGYGIRVDKVIDGGEKTIVRVKKSSPPPGAMVTMAITQPYDIVAIPKSDRPIEFKNVGPKRPIRPFPGRPFPKPVPGRPVLK